MCLRRWSMEIFVLLIAVNEHIHTNTHARTHARTHTSLRCKHVQTHSHQHMHMHSHKHSHKHTGTVTRTRTGIRTVNLQLYNTIHIFHIKLLSHKWISNLFAYSMCVVHRVFLCNLPLCHITLSLVTVDNNLFQSVTVLSEKYLN